MIDGPGGELQLARARKNGAIVLRTFQYRIVLRTFLYWRNVAPAGEQRRRPQFDARDHADPGYQWEGFDGQVKAIVAARLKPLVVIHSAPQWAYPADAEINDVAFRPDPDELGLVARAAAQRYSGRVEGLPRVRLWEARNESKHQHLPTPTTRERPPRLAWPLSRDGERDRGGSEVGARRQRRRRR